MLLKTYIEGLDTTTPVAEIKRRILKTDPEAKLTSSTVQYWVDQALAGEPVVIKTNRGVPYWIGREKTYWSKP